MNNLETLQKVCRAAVFVGGVMFIAAAFYVTAEVLARKLFLVSLGGANEISGYVLAVSSAWAFGFALLERSHIRIDVFYRLCPARLRAVIDLLALMAVAGFAAVLAWFSYGTFEFAWRVGARSNTPLQAPQWIPIGLWYAGLLAFLLIALWLIVCTGRALYRGDLQAVTRLAGTPQVDEEAAEFIDLEDAWAEPAHGPGKA